LSLGVRGVASPELRRSHPGAAGGREDPQLLVAAASHDRPTCAAPRQFTRRALLGGLAALPLAALLPGRADALGPRSKLRLAQLAYSGGNPAPRPHGLHRLAWELDKRTSIDVALEPVTLRVADRTLFEHPFLYLGGDRAFELLPAPDLERLRSFLVYGGFLLVDSADSRPGGGFDQSVRALAASLFPRQPLRKLKTDHTVGKSFYLLEQPVGRVVSVPYLEGVEVDGRLVLLYFQNDLGGALSRDAFGQWEFAVYPGGDQQREMAARWGINIVMYAMCLDYKADQVHIPFILKRRQWQVRP